MRYVLITCVYHSLFARNQRYGCLRYVKALAIIRIKMVVSVVQSIDTFSLKKNWLLALCLPVTWLSCSESCPENCSQSILKRGRIDWIWFADLRFTKIEEDKTNSLLWLGFHKLLEIFIGDENMETFMEDATLKVFFFNSTVVVAQLLVQ